MLQEKHALPTRTAPLRARKMRAAQKAHLLLGTAALSVFALGGYLSISTSNGTQPVRALGLQTALFPVAPTASVAVADTTEPTPTPDATPTTPAPAPAPAAPVEPAAASARDDDARESASEAEGSFFQQGHTSYYAHEFAGRRTANGERFNPEAMTAAHKTLPFGTRIRVTSTATGRSVVVRVNDRGPFVRGRILDLSLGAARALGIHRSGGGQVRIHVLGRGSRRSADVTPAPAPQTSERRVRRTPEVSPSERPMRTAAEMTAPALPDSTTP